MALTRPLVIRHALNRGDSYEAALLDVAQDHLLRVLQLHEVFSGSYVVLKGGTSLRKCRLGRDGRFSTDLDLVVPGDDDVLRICEIVNNARIGGFTFILGEGSASGRIWKLNLSHENLGSVSGIARLEFAQRGLILPSEWLPPVSLPIHEEYGFTLDPLPVIGEVEACAEKLARYRRTPLTRDLYDLAWFATRPLDERLLRRLWVLKVFCDVIEDGRGIKPLDPEQVLAPRSPRDFNEASIGILTCPVDIPAWEAKVRKRFSFLRALDEDESRWATCNHRHLVEVRAALAAGGFNTSMTGTEDAVGVE